MRKNFTFSKAGFSLVETIVVMVVMGLLATLVVSAYSDTQQRARNNSRNASAKELQYILNLYVQQEGKYPYDAQACIGVEYTDWDGDGSQDCFTKATGITPIHPSPVIDSELLKVVKKIPKVETSIINANGSILLRGFFTVPNAIIDDIPGRFLFGYYLEGTNQKCYLPGILSISNSPTRYYTTSNTNSIANASGATACYISVNNVDTS